MKLEKQIRLVFILLIVLAAVLMVVPVVLADNGHGHDHGSGDVDIDSPVDVNVTGGDTNVPVDVNVMSGDSPVSVNHQSRALALSNVLGDVDIAGCLGSTQWATPLFSKQKLVVNWPCLTEFYLRQGKYELAAMAICNTEIVKEFADEAECEAAHDFSSLAPEPAAMFMDQQRQIEEHHQEDIQVVKMSQASLEERISVLEKKPAPRPRVVTEQKPAFTQEQVEAAYKALMGEDEE